MIQTLPIPDQPLKVALVGTGTRSQTIYGPLLTALAPWVEIVAVCDPVRENADRFAQSLGVPSYYDIRQLVSDRPMEAALVVTPIDSHHAISVFLSSNGIHNLTETTWASMVCQAKEMVKTARENTVVTRVAENFFRFPIDRFAQTVRDSDSIGRIGRIFSYADHTGYHNNSRWIVFAKSHPEWVQSVEHTMSHPPFYSMPQRRHEEETLRARFFGFPGNFLVTDIGSGHVKGHLGRHPRPGYTEWHGDRGTLVHRAPGACWGSEETEIRRCSDAKFAPAQETSGSLWGGGVADEISPVVHEYANEFWTGAYAQTPNGVIAYKSPIQTNVRVGKVNNTEWYGVAVMGHIIDFALAVRGLRDSEFTDEDALMSEMMEVGTRESALNEGKRIRLPIEGELESDALTRDSLKNKYGVDPLDVDAMLAISYLKP
jgi:hypothetical protein